MKKPSGLGRGLGAIIDSSEYSTPQPQKTAINEIPVSEIETNPWQPRTDFDQDELERLATSIRSMGIIQPLTLRRLGEHKYQVIAGERRLRASQMAGLDKVPAYIRDTDDDKMLELALVENIQRADLNPIEEALSYQRLIDECNLTQENMGDRVGKSRSTITNSLRLLKLPPEIQQALRARELSMGHARAIMGIDDPDIQISLYQQAVEFGYSVRRIEELVRQYKEENTKDEGEEPKPAKKSKKRLAPVYEEIKSQFCTFFKKSDIKLDRAESGKGKITIPFDSDDELKDILETLLLDNKGEE
ncbi:MAG: ParB/RepB/Spo0J family partition protein [Bacteroidia bacterium]|nr:ParB/RepB/Spo0J family partition protein [Bacteroidia bacterium]